MLRLRFGSATAFDHRPLIAPSRTHWVLLVLLLGTAVVLWAFLYPEPSDICIRNDTGVPLTSVRINGVDYGDVAAGSTTPYLKHQHAHECASFTLYVDGVPARDSANCISPSLSPGKFAYVL